MKQCPSRSATLYRQIDRPVAIVCPARYGGDNYDHGIHYTRITYTHTHIYTILMLMVDRLYVRTSKEGAESHGQRATAIVVMLSHYFRFVATVLSKYTVCVRTINVTRNIRTPDLEFHLGGFFLLHKVVNITLFFEIFKCLTFFAHA